MPLPKDLLEILVCPFCKGDLREEGDALKCLRAECGLIFAVKDGIPDMLIDEAKRPCPKCPEQRAFKTEWVPDDRPGGGKRAKDMLICPKCSTTYVIERK
jgi:hypothetical protein